MATVVRADVYVKSSVSATQSTDDGGPQDQPTSPPSAPTPRPPPARRRDSARTSPLPLGTTKRPSFGQALDATPLQNAPTPSPADAPRIELATPSDASSHRPSPYTHPWITATPDTPASSHRTPYRTSSLRLNRSQTSFADVSAHITDISKWGRASGGYCDVHTGVLSGVGPVALKKLRMHAQTDSAQAEKRFRHEAEMWCRLDHKHVLPFLGICVDGPNLYMCSSWQDNGDLPHYLKDHPDADRFALMTQTAEALLYLHENGVIHGDLKGNNVLISSNGEALLCDFGLAIVLSEIAVMSGLPSDLGGKGTWRYMAPELFAVADDVDVAKTSSSDVFAYGMLLAETITGQIPMHHLHNEPAVLWAISNGTRPTRPHIWRDTHEEVLWSLAEHCWDARPSERPESADIVAFLQWYTPVRNGIPPGRASVPLLWEAIGSQTQLELPAVHPQVADRSIHSRVTIPDEGSDPTRLWRPRVFLCTSIVISWSMVSLTIAQTVLASLSHPHQRYAALPGSALWPVTVAASAWTMLVYVPRSIMLSLALLFFLRGPLSSSKSQVRRWWLRAPLTWLSPLLHVYGRLWLFAICGTVVCALQATEAILIRVVVRAHPGSTASDDALVTPREALTWSIVALTVVDVGCWTAMHHRRDREDSTSDFAIE